ncbi:MAG: hypothetical protein QXR58_00540 [Candidatus Micrarchaeaceae archaeon]
MKIGFLLVVALVALASSGIAFAGTSGPTPIPNPPTFYVNTNTLMLCKGQTNYVPITVTNPGPSGPSYPSIGISNLTGTAMDFVQLSISPTKGVLPVGNAITYIGVVRPNTSETAYIPIFLTDNASLITSVGIQITYYYDVFYSDSETRNITFEVGTCPSQLSVSVNPKTVTPGEIQNISVNITNNGNTTLKNLYIHYTVPSIDGAVVGSSSAELGTLAAGAQHRLNISLFVSRNASIESFPFNLTTTFYNGANSIEQVYNTTSFIPIGSIDLLSSGLTLSPSVVSPGGIVSISFVLTDIGTSGASAVSVGAIVPQGFSAFGSNPVYVGDISADSQSPVTISLEVSDTVKPGQYSIPLRINYLNSLRQNVTTTRNVTVTVGSSSFASNVKQTAARTSPSGRESSVLTVVSIILAIALVCVSYLFYKEKKKGRRHEKT